MDELEPELVSHSSNFDDPGGMQEKVVNSSQSSTCTWLRWERNCRRLHGEVQELQALLSCKPSQPSAQHHLGMLCPCLAAPQRLSEHKKDHGCC